MSNENEINDLKTEAIKLAEEQTKSIEKIKSLLLKYNKNVIPDNDFQRAYNIPFDKFKDCDKKDLIEVLFILVSIMDENELDLTTILGEYEG